MWTLGPLQVEAGGGHARLSGEPASAPPWLPSDLEWRLRAAPWAATATAPAIAPKLQSQTHARKPQTPAHALKNEEVAVRPPLGFWRRERTPNQTGQKGLVDLPAHLPFLPGPGTDVN